MKQDQFSNPNYDWEKRELIGQGGFGKVFKVKNNKTGDYVAIKQLDMSKFQEQYQKQALINEIGIQKELTNSPFTVMYYDHYIGKQFTFIVSQLCDGDLKKEIEQKGGKLSQEESANIFRQIIGGFKLLTDKGYIHRDVKPENILTKNGFHKISDFGFSRKADIHGGSKIKQVCGTPLYMAPQLLMNEEYTSKCDIWSLGLMLYEMIFGFGPWPSRQPDAYKQSILTKPVSFPYGSKIGNNTKDFILRSLIIEETKRMSWKDVFNHPLVTKGLGQDVKAIPVKKQTQGILQRVQESSWRKAINVRQLFNKLSTNLSLKLNKKQFQQLIYQVDPTITTHESEQIFRVADLTNDGSVDTHQFQRIICEVDYRPVEDVASRRIQEIIAMAKARGMSIRSFFEMFDIDRSGSIDKEEFTKIIKHIAPQISMVIIKEMWDKFDRDKSGTVSAQEFMDQMTRGVPNEGSQIGPNRERAKRNILCLKEHLKKVGITAKQFIIKTDQNNSRTLSIEEFGPMIQKINYVITKQQIMEMFKLIDNNKDGEIDIEETIAFFQ